MANTYLTRTISSGGADLTKWTWSCWVKKTDLVGVGNGCQRIMSNEVSGNNKSWYIRFQPNGEFHAWSNNGAFEFTTNAKYRDVNGWHHFVIKYDSTQSTESDRFKVYVNGEQPSMSNIHYPTLNETVNFMNTGNYIDIGYYRQTPGEYFFGLLSHMHFTAGYAYDASTFGSTDSTTGEWKINTSPSVTYGSLGFFILKDGNTITDSSPNSNNFSLGGGTLTKTEDNPSNVFATMNPLDNQNQASQFTNGNTKVEWHHDNKNIFATLAMNAGKYYWEMKYVITSGGTNAMIGISKCDSRQADDYAGHDANSWSYYASSGQKYHGTGVNYGNTWGVDDIIGVAFDTDTRTIWFSKNGTWQNSATISEIAAGTTTNSAYTGIGTAGEFFIPCISAYDQNKVAFNFGNGYFSTTAVSSAGTNASGNGIFEYDVPTGYTALSTKGLNL